MFIDLPGILLTITSCYLNGSQKSLRQVRFHSRFSHHLQIAVAHLDAKLLAAHSDQVAAYVRDAGIRHTGNDVAKCTMSVHPFS